MTYLDFDGTCREAVKGLRVVLNDFKKRGHGDAENIPNSVDRMF